MNENPYIKALESTGCLSEPAIRNAITTLNLADGSKVLDVPCGTGSHAQWMLEKYPNVKITGVDIAEAHVEHAKEKLKNAGKSQSCEFIVGDINKLEFANNSFDFVWCCDGLWPGPQEMGCPAEAPYDILSDMVRITKPGGKIAVLFWSSQKILPGYPFLEATLNATKSANMPINPKTNPELHFMLAPVWLNKAGLTNIEIKTFVADIPKPKNEYHKEGLLTLFNMFWGRAETEITKEVWEKFKNITNPESDECVLSQKGYTGFLTYTMFTGEVSY